MRHRLLLVQLGSMGPLERVDLDLLNALADNHAARSWRSPNGSGCPATRSRRGWPPWSPAASSVVGAAIPPLALGLPIEAMVSVTVRQAELPRITQAIATLPEVVQAYGMSGQVDLLVRVAARDTQHLFDVDARILAIDGVERTETSLVMGEVIGYRIRPLLESAREDAIR